MSEEIKEILENVKKCCKIMKDQSFVIYQRTDILKLLDYIQQKENIIKEIKLQLDYLETYSSKEDVYEDMARRLNNIEKIIGDSSNE